MCSLSLYGIPHRVNWRALEHVDKEKGDAPAEIKEVGNVEHRLEGACWRGKDARVEEEDGVPC